MDLSSKHVKIGGASLAGLGLIAGLLIGAAAPSSDPDMDSAVTHCQAVAEGAEDFMKRSRDVYAAYIRIEQTVDWDPGVADDERLTRELGPTVDQEAWHDMRDDLRKCADSPALD